jgi:hypothetical protein
MSAERDLVTELQSGVIIRVEGDAFRSANGKSYPAGTILLVDPGQPSKVLARFEPE